MANERAIETLERILKELKDGASENGHAPRNHPLVWSELRDMDFNHEWLVERFWPIGAHVHIFASPKTGKSLLGLWVAANIAMGIDPFTWDKATRHKVSYIDNEMTLKDVQERTTDMGFEFEQLEGWLHYFSYPILAPMDTPSGGIETLEMMNDYESEVLIIDTLSRVVKGEENSNDTYRNFYNHTGRLLKSHDKSVCRFDHAGHDPKKSRGASAKADDVDLVYGLEKRSSKDEAPGFRLTRTHARVSGILDVVELALNDDPLSIKGTHGRTWSEGAIKKAKELDHAKVPIDASRRQAIGLLRDMGYGPGKTTILTEAMKLREYRQPIDEFIR